LADETSLPGNRPSISTPPNPIIVSDRLAPDAALISATTPPHATEIRPHSKGFACYPRLQMPGEFDPETLLAAYALPQTTPTPAHHVRTWMDDVLPTAPFDPMDPL